MTYLTLLRTNSNDNSCVGNFALLYFTIVLLKMASQGWLCKNTCRRMLKLMKDVERSIRHLSLHIRGSSVQREGWIAAGFGGLHDIRNLHPLRFHPHPLDYPRVKSGLGKSKLQSRASTSRSMKFFCFASYGFHICWSSHLKAFQLT